MPYTAVGKCVYKKTEDGKRGEKVGCTKGAVKDYLAALSRAANEFSNPRAVGRRRSSPYVDASVVIFMHKH